MFLKREAKLELLDGAEPGRPGHPDHPFEQRFGAACMAAGDEFHIAVWLGLDP